MDGQHRYEINLKKDDLFINLSSDDVYFISKQMDKWFRILLDDSYVPVAMPQRPEPAPQPQPVPQVQQAPPPPPPVVEAPPVVSPEPVMQQAPPPQPVAVEVTAQPQVMEQTAAPQATVELPMAQPSLPQNPPPVPQGLATQGPPVPLDEAVQDDFEAVMDSLMKDLEGEESPAPAMAGHTASELAYVGANPGEYTAHSQGNGAGKKADLSMIDSLAELCDRSHAANSEDYLLLSAYYLTYFEGLEKFSLKKVNSMLVKSGLTPVNHSILETTLSRGLLSMIPDMTGMAEVTEYVLTEDGQQYANSLL